MYQQRDAGVYDMLAITNKNNTVGEGTCTFICVKATFARVFIITQLTRLSPLVSNPSPPTATGTRRALH